ncbi:MAG: GTP 3',8-cyclase MoaA [Limisphaerales bacterium]
MSTSAGLTDSFGRVMRDLRVSVTDRCNFRCLYCLPETEEAANFYRTRFDPGKNPHPASLHRTIVHAWKPRDALLTFEEIERAVRVAVSLGVEKVRLTGGEPLLRQGFERLVARLAGVPGVRDLAMTTNGFLFAPKARALRDAGLRRVSFSLDSLDRENFRRLTGRDGLADVLAAVRLACGLGFGPVKVNAVIIRGLNDHEIEALADWAGSEGVTLRFIEFMPLDSGRAWQRGHVVPGHEILTRLRARHGLLPVAPADPAETASRWRVPGGAEIGIIAPVSEPFCGHCNRIRLTADGQVRTCLFSLGEHDLKARLRDGSDDEVLAAWLRGVVWHKEERHHIGEPGFAQPARSMSCIGG